MTSDNPQQPIVNASTSHSAMLTNYLSEHGFSDKCAPSLVQWQQLLNRLEQDSGLMDQRFSAILSALPDLLFLLDEDGRYLDVMTGCENRLFIPKDDILGKTLHEVLPVELADNFIASIHECLNCNDVTVMHYEMQVPAGYTYFEGRIAPVDYTVANKRTVIFLAMDVSKRNEAIRHDRLISHIIHAAREGVVVMDDQFNVLSANPAYCQLVSKKEKRVIGLLPDFLIPSKPQSYAIKEKLLQGTGWIGEIAGHRSDGSEFPLWLTCEAVTNDLSIGSRDTLNYVALLTDVSEIKRSREELEHVATHDALTGLPNRVLFEDRMKQAMARSQRSGKLVALLFLDLNRFKMINDNLGHQVGDELLMQVAERLTMVRRAEDTLARFGGDEFLIVSENLNKAEDAAVIARHIMNALSAPFFLGEYRLEVTTSIGISIFPSDTEDAEQLLKNADSAMYQAKDVEGSAYQFYTHDLTVNAFKYFSMEMGLRNAIKQQQFTLNYQPQYHLASGKMIGVEALLRWSHPDLGQVPPAHFIPVAENSGLINALGDWVIRAACQQIVAWDQQGVEPFPVAVNVSRRQLADKMFTPRLIAVLEEYEISGERLEVEITESTIIDNEEAAFENLRQLHELGVALSIDDFGTGHSSLINLKRFPLDRLKIDRDFVRDLTSDNTDAAIICATIALARSFELEVIAEGVETLEQRDFLVQAGCDHVQGYLYGRPMLAEKIPECLVADASLLRTD